MIQLKKVLAILLVLGVVFSVVACNGGANNSDSNGTSGSGNGASSDNGGGTNSGDGGGTDGTDRKSTRLNSSH